MSTHSVAIWLLADVWYILSCLFHPACFNVHTYERRKLQNQHISTHVFYHSTLKGDIVLYKCPCTAHFKQCKPSVCNTTKMHSSIIVIAGMAILALGSCVSTVDDYYEKTSLDLLEQDTLYSDSPCDLCSNHSICELYKITVLREKGSSLQMCVDMLSANKCCNVIASNCASYPLDVRGIYVYNRDMCIEIAI